MEMRLLVSLACVGCLAFAGTSVVLGASRGVAKSLAASEAGALPALAARLKDIALVREATARSQRKERRDEALRDLPSMLDVVTLGLSSGLSFDSSLELYCQRSTTSLAAAFGEAMLLWRMGIRGRDDALRELAEDLDVSALRRFAGAVSQALAFGSPLATVLEQQAQAIREEQRSEMEAEIERVPVKMLIPLGTLIVPAMLLSILGPLLSSSIGVSN